MGFHFKSILTKNFLTCLAYCKTNLGKSLGAHQSIKGRIRATSVS